MNIYQRIGISFMCNGKEYRIDPTALNDYEDKIEILTYYRHPDLKRGCVGSLEVYSHDGIDVETGSNNIEQKDLYQDVLLKNILIYGTGGDEAVEYRYIFLKD